MSMLRFAQRAAPVRAFASGKAGVAMSIHEPKNLFSYEQFADKVDRVRKLRGNHPLTYAEKVVYGHLDDINDAPSIVRGESYLKLRPGAFMFWFVVFCLLLISF